MDLGGRSTIPYVPMSFFLMYRSNSASKCGKSHKSQCFDVMKLHKMSDSKITFESVQFLEKLVERGIGTTCISFLKPHRLVCYVRRIINCGFD